MLSLQELCANSVISYAPGRSAPGSPRTYHARIPWQQTTSHPTEAQKYRADINDRVFPRNLYTMECHTCLRWYLFGSYHQVHLQFWLLDRPIMYVLKPHEPFLGKYGYSWSPQMRRALCPSKVLEASSRANYHGLIHHPSGSQLPAMHPSIENVNDPLPVSFSQQWICAHWHFRMVSMFSYGVWVYR